MLGRFFKHLAPTGPAGPVEQRPWVVPLIVCAIWGLSPFVPEPHLIEKLAWLQAGRPFRSFDVFDLIAHGAPWIWFLWSFLGDLGRSPDQGAERHR